MRLETDTSTVQKNTLTSQYFRKKNELEIFLIKLDTIDNLKLNNFNYWKIDVEEVKKVLKGAYQTLEKSPSIIQIEV